MLLAFLALAGSVCAAAADTLIGSIFNADTFPAGEITNIDIEVDLEMLASMDHRCQEHCENVDRDSDNTMRGRLSDDHPIVASCSGKDAEASCTVSLPELGPLLDDGIGLCVEGWLKHDSPVCIPSEVLAGGELCHPKLSQNGLSQRTFKPGDACRLGPAGRQIDGVCASDSAGTGALGCTTPTAARFLRYVSHGITGHPSPIAARVGVSRGGDRDRTEATLSSTLLRRHGASSLCRGLEAGSGKLPLHLQRAGNRSDRVILSTGGAGFDPAKVRSFVAAKFMASNGIVAGRHALVRVFMNSEYIGVYTAIEQLDSAIIGTKLVSPPLPIDASALVMGLLRTGADRSRGAEDIFQLPPSGWEPPADIKKADRKKMLSVPGGSFVRVLNRTNDVWSFAVDGNGNAGFLPADFLLLTSCRSLPGTVYEPRSRFADYDFHEFTAIDGPQPSPAWKHLDALWTVLSNSKLRTQSPLEWEYALERVIDVKAWLRWLAVNKVVGNWDSYGSTTGNLLMYFPPCGEPGTIVPFDFDASFPVKNYIGAQEDKKSFLPVGAKGKRWPLVGLLLKDASYRALYEKLLAEALLGLDRAFETFVDDTIAKIAQYIDPESALGEDQSVTLLDWDEYIEGTDALRVAVRQRSELVRHFLFPDLHSKHAHASQGRVGGKGAAAVSLEPALGTAVMDDPMLDDRAGRKRGRKNKIAELNKLAAKPSGGDEPAGRDVALQVSHGLPDPQEGSNCVYVNHVSDSPGELTCDCVDPTDPCRPDGCPDEPLCADSGSGSGVSAPSQTPVLSAETKTKSKLGGQRGETKETEKNETKEMPDDKIAELNELAAKPSGGDGRDEPAGRDVALQMAHELREGSNCVYVNHVSDSPGELTCDCVDPTDPCRLDDCPDEPLCADSGSGSGVSAPSQTPVLYAETKAKTKLGDQRRQKEKKEKKEKKTKKKKKEKKTEL